MPMIPTMWRLLVMLLCSAALNNMFSVVAQAQDEPELPPLQPFIIQHNGVEYENLLYVPSSYSDEGQFALPMLVVFHGAGGSARRMSIMSGFDVMAERDEVLILYADSPMGYWDYGAGLPEWEHVLDQTDHPGAVLALIEAVQVDYRVRELYLTGFSNGARMAWRTACDLGTRVAGVSGVAGTLSTEIRDYCPDTLQALVFYMQGTNDVAMPWEGKSLSLGGQVISEALAVPVMLAWWAQHNGCNLTPTETTLFDANPADHETFTQLDYTACDNSAPVRFVRVNGGGHNWTGGLPNLVPDNWLPSGDASTMLWDFFGFSEAGTTNDTP